MRPELAGDVQGALAILGMALQFLRAQRRVSDWFTINLAIFIALGLWALSVDWNAVSDWQAFGLKAILGIGGCVGAILGGIFGTAQVANNALGTKHEGNPMIPATNSQGGT